jgi:hypothetical protein
MKRIWIYLFALIFFSCDHSTNPITAENSTSTVIMPLKIGNKWIFENTDFDSTGAVVRTYVDTLAIIGEMMVDEQRWFIANEDCIVRNSAEGLCSALLVGGKISNMSLVAKFPGSTGDKWNYGYNMIASSDILVNVPYGDFHCFRYEGEMHLEDAPSISYLAPGIGILLAYYKKETADGSKYLNKVTELKDVIFN